MVSVNPQQRDNAGVTQAFAPLLVPIPPRRLIQSRAPAFIVAETLLLLNDEQTQLLADGIEGRAARITRAADRSACRALIVPGR